MKPTDIILQARGMACRCGCGSMEPVGQKGADLARRGFLCKAIAGTAVMLAGATLIRARPASAQSTLTPDAALKKLMDGNQRYVGGQLQSLDEDLSILKARTAEKQEPFAAVLSCADSRVPVEFVFDQSIGQLFVVRVAGSPRPRSPRASNMASPFWAPRSSWCWGTAIAARSKQPLKARPCLARSASFTPPSSLR